MPSIEIHVRKTKLWIVAPLARRDVLALVASTAFSKMPLLALDYGFGCLGRVNIECSQNKATLGVNTAGLSEYYRFAVWDALATQLKIGFADETFVVITPFADIVTEAKDLRIRMTARGMGRPKEVEL